MSDAMEATPPLPTPSLASEAINQADCIRILVATDNHIGYAERDPVRGRDSFNTFREVLQIAIDQDVDMLLLGGDLFHENKPSRNCMYQVTAMLREFCLNRRPINLNIVSDAGVGIQTGFDFPSINYEDENFNVGLPVFSIHGNHDDPQGAGPEGALCALDILSASGLINYFGRQDLPGEATTDEEAREKGLQIRPILLQKGRTKLAIYGIGNIRDERFHAEMRKNRISFFRPTEDSAEWFNLLVIHQNRVPHGPKSSVPENGFGDEVDLIIWGHEHDCRIIPRTASTEPQSVEPEIVGGKAYRILQPGSSIATSLAEGESLPKHVALLQVQDRSYALDAIPLQTVRPFKIAEVNLAEAAEVDGQDLTNKSKVTKYLKAKVLEVLKEEEDEWVEAHPNGTAEEKAKRLLPLLRLKVDYTGNFEIGNPQRFGQEFTAQVANPKDIIHFTKRKKVGIRKEKVTADQPDLEDEEVDGLDEKFKKVKMETLVRQYLGAQQLKVLLEPGMARAVELFVDKDERDAIKETIKENILKRVGDAVEKQITRGRDSEDEIEENITKSKEQELKDYETKGPQRKGKGKAKKVHSSDDSDDDFGVIDSEEEPAKKSKTSKGKAPAKNSRKEKEKSLFDDDSDESPDSDISPPKKQAAAKTSAKAPPKKVAAPKATTSKKKAAQSQLNFAPDRSTGTRAAASKAKKSIEAIEVDSDSGDSSEAPPPPKKRK